MDGLFELIGAPLEERQRLAAGQLRDDAFDRWSVYKIDRADWTYDEFRSLMLREYSPPGLQTAREVTFFRGSYDETLSVAEIIRQFKKELVYCGHLCQTDASRIRLLSMRLSPAVLLHASSLGDVTFDRFLEVILRYDAQRLLSAAAYQYSHPPRGEKRPRVIESSRDMYDRGDIRRAPPAPFQEVRVPGIACRGCYEEGHTTEGCPRRHVSCYTCGGRGHRSAYCPQRRGPFDTPVHRLPAAPRPPQLTYPRSQERGFSTDMGRGGFRGGRGTGHGDSRQTSAGAFERRYDRGQMSGGRDTDLPPPPRVYQMRAEEYPAPPTAGSTDPSE